MRTKTADEVRDSFIRRGEAIAAWARSNGFCSSQVFAVLSGRNKGLRGKAHDIAVRLGMKDGVLRQP